MLMYKAMVLEEGGKLEEALAHLAVAKACLYCHRHDMHSVGTCRNSCRVTPDSVSRFRASAVV